MRILLRSRDTKLYYAGQDEWETEPEKAVPFPSSIHAWRLVLKGLERQQLELVYFFNDQEENFSCPIDPPPPRALL